MACTSSVRPNGRDNVSGHRPYTSAVRPVIMRKGGSDLVAAVDQELAAIKRLLRDYKVLSKAQIRRYFKTVGDRRINKVLSLMCQRGMIHMQENYVALNKQDLADIDEKRLKAFWVLIDQPAVVYHCLGQWPVQIYFLQEAEGEIIYAALGEERAINAHLRGEEIKRIIVVEELDQIMELEVDGVVYYCTVDAQGAIAKYIKE